MTPSRVAIVTGASSGIGHASALRLQAAGFTVYAGARRVEKMKDLADAGVHPVDLDVTDDASMVALVDRVIADTGRIDVLVNNAGYGSFGAVEDTPIAEGRRQFDVNVFGLARMTQLVLPHMRARRSGRIINMSSMGGRISEPLGGWYHATKFAVEGMSGSLRVELRPFGIDVVLIEPGGMNTEWGEIAANGLIAASGSTAYADQAPGVAKMLRSIDEKPRPSASPDRIAKAVTRAATARRPRVRYLLGPGAKPLVTLQTILPDRVFDAMMARIFGTPR
ncbi:MAG TPA: oxidoreductase [Acidothermaceae bacterium]|jgi:NAD(P)-dependent dehydrogenase (short-subunit alcohol dehydrogenase family)